MTHALSTIVCQCGTERTSRRSKIRLGLVKACQRCAKAEAAQRGSLTRRKFSPEEMVFRNRWGTYKQNAKAKGLAMLIDFAAARALFVAACDYCGGPGFGIDRLDSGVGYVVGNLAPCCSTCNYAKRDMPRLLFIEWIHRAHENLLQRDRALRLRLAVEPDGRGTHHAGNHL